MDNDKNKHNHKTQPEFDECCGFGSTMPTRGLAALKTKWQMEHLKPGDTLGGIKIPPEWIKDGKLIPKEKRQIRPK